MEEELIRISAPHFVAGRVTKGLCAPIIRYMRFWSIDRIAAYCKKKGWTLEIIKE